VLLYYKFFLKILNNTQKGVVIRNRLDSRSGHHPSAFINIAALYPIGPENPFATPIEMSFFRATMQLFTFVAYG